MSHLSLLQVRSTGPVNPVTRQPIKGRKFGGGIRFGEMERDALLAHGAAYLLHDRLHTCSDYTVMEVCSACGSLLSPNQFIPTAAAADMPRTAGGKQLQRPLLLSWLIMLYGQPNAPWWCKALCLPAVVVMHICCTCCLFNVTGSSSWCYSGFS